MYHRVIYTILLLILLPNVTCSVGVATNRHSKKLYDPCKVHAFYYLWYGVPEHNNGKYLHWNHEVLPHWDDVQNIKLKNVIGKRFNPPEEIHSPFYPQRGLYSSSDPKILDQHMQIQYRQYWIH